MSNIYILEPPTSGKVLLKTTVGDIDLELWSKETPKTCRNFIQLCMEGYYNGTIFHRVVSDFIVQGGDPKGDGTGGESIYGEPFKDEFHQRLRFARRGLLAMANGGKDDNGSQFFFTLASTPELQNKHTIFGKVTGDTVFNMLKLEEGLIENERPVYPHKIIKADVLNNPFTDIEPRIIEAAQPAEKNKKVKSAAVKNFKLLSFGEEAEEDEEETSKETQRLSGKSKSTHDVLDDPKLSSKTTELPSDNEDESSETDHEEQLQNIRKKLKTDQKRFSVSKYYLDKDKIEEKKKKCEEIKQEIMNVKREYHQNKLQKDKKKTEEEQEETERSETFKKYKEEYDKYKDLKKTLPKKGAGREQFTLDLLNKFKQKLNNARESAAANNEASKDVDSDEDENWLAHELHFEDKVPVLAKDANTKTDDWFEIYDPRNVLNKRRRGEATSKKK